MCCGIGSRDDTPPLCSVRDLPARIGQYNEAILIEAQPSDDAAPPNRQTCKEIHACTTVGISLHPSPSSDIDAAVAIDCNDVGQPLVPSLLVHERLVQLVLARVGVHPPILSWDPDLG